MSLSIKEPFPNRYLYCPNGCVLCFGGVRFCRDVDPTRPPQPLIKPPDPRVYKHCSTTANPIFKILSASTPPPKNFKKFPRHHVKRWTTLYKKIPRASADVPGEKMATKPSRRSNDLRHHRKEVYTNTNEATSATPALTLRNARTFD
jgi:hypothetical protein